MAVQTRILINAKDGSSKVFSRVSESTKTLQSRTKLLTASFVKLGGALVGLVGVAGFGRLVRAQIDAGDELQKLTIRIGASTESLSQYRLVTKLAGVEFSSFTKGLTKLQNSLGEASRGTGEAVFALERLGLTANDLIALNVSQQFETIADAIQSIENPSLRTQTALDLFGRSGAELLQIMEGGSKQILKVRKEADSLGGTLTRLQADQMANVNDEFARFDFMMQNIFKDIANELGPSLMELGRFLQDVLPFAVKGSLAAFSSFSLGMKQISFEIADLLGSFSKQWKDAAAIIKGEIEDIIFNQGKLGKFEGTFEVKTGSQKSGSVGLEGENRGFIGNRFKITPTTEQKLLNDFNVSRAENLSKSSRFTIEPVEILTEESKRFQIAGMDELMESMEKMSRLGDDIGSSFANAFEGILTGASSSKDILRSLLQDLTQIGLRGFVTGPLQGAISSGFSSLFSSPAAGGSPDKGGGGNPAGLAPVVSQTFNISTPDANSFKLSQTQIFARGRQSIAGAV